MHNPPAQIPPPPPAKDSVASRVLFGILGFPSAALSAFCFFAAASDLLTGTMTSGDVSAMVGILSMTAVFGLISTVMSWIALGRPGSRRNKLQREYQSQYSLQQQQQRAQQLDNQRQQPQFRYASDGSSQQTGTGLHPNRERVVLHLARILDGKLMAADVASRTEMTIAEARAALQHMEREGVAEQWPNQRGDMVYVFPSFAKQEAHDHVANPMGATPDSFFAEHGIDEQELEEQARRQEQARQAQARQRQAQAAQAQQPPARSQPARAAEPDPFADFDRKLAESSPPPETSLDFDQGLEDITQQQDTSLDFEAQAQHQEQGEEVAATARMYVPQNHED